MLANVLQMQGRRDEVVTFLRSKRKLYGDSPRFLVTLAEAQYDTVNYAAARADLERAISLDPGMEIAHYLLGNTLVRLKEADAAIDEYNSAIRLAPRKARTHYGLGLALLLRADDAGAEGALKNSLTIDPQYAPAHCELGKLYQKQGRLPEAVEELNSAIQCNPRYTVAYYHLGETYRQMGDKRDSVKAFAAFQALKEKEPKQKPPMNDRLP
jgi:tetratricopeptide (TPR) repeat protein